MNYHYIDFMIREQQKLVLEECQRSRMLRMARKQNSSSPKREKESVVKEMLICFRTIIQRKQKVSATVR